MEKQKKVDQTNVITATATLVFAGQSGAAQEVVQSWRTLGAIAHALPWEVTTHPTSIHQDNDGVRTTTLTASWIELQGELSYAYEFLRLGWRLIDQRGSAAG